MHQNPSSYPSQIINNNNPNLQFPEHEHLNCPRCDSNNTKFCYYNNYNLSQPRHYCKNCRRYWTKGGTLRKIPIGGGTRKSNKRSSSSNKLHHADSSKSTVDNNNNNSRLSGGSEKNDLKESGLVQVNCVNGGESSGDVWPNLSIFTSGSDFR